MGPPSEERGRRGRGRRPERRAEPEPERFAEPEDEEVTDMEPAVTAVEEEDDGPEDNLADLNVPAWGDLIASLYRPER